MPHQTKTVNITKNGLINELKTIQMYRGELAKQLQLINPSELITIERASGNLNRISTEFEKIKTVLSEGITCSALKLQADKDNTQLLRIIIDNKKTILEQLISYCDTTLGFINDRIKGGTDTYKTLLTNNMTRNRLLVMPEAAIPLFADEAKSYLAPIHRALLAQHSALITGIALRDSGGRHDYNGMLALGESHGYYYKRHLVLLGEYIPLADYLTDWVNRFIAIPLSSLTPGPSSQPPIEALGIRIAPFICYEIAYPDLVSKSQRSAGLLLVLSDDSWFGRSWAAAQHLQIAQMRALENGRFLLFSTNDGITAVIDPSGVVIKRLPHATRGSLSATLVPMQGVTPVGAWGSQLSLLVSLLCMGAALV